jgi:hypothetical protein
VKGPPRGSLGPEPRAEEAGGGHGEVV